MFCVSSWRLDRGAAIVSRASRSQSPRPRSTSPAVVAEKEPGPRFGNADMSCESVEVVLDWPIGDRILTGCGPGEGGMQGYFADRDNGRTTDDCAEIVAGDR